jgi:hypothetical protein
MRSNRRLLSRLLVLAVVVGGHLGVLLLASKNQVMQRQNASMNSAPIELIFIPVPPPPKSRDDSGHEESRQKMARSAGTIANPTNPIHLDEPKLPQAAVESNNAIDWELEKQRAAASMFEVPKTREFGTHQKEEVQEPRREGPWHKVGDAYTNAYGEIIVWVSDNCYVASESPLPSAPDVVARMPTHTVCVRHRHTEGELFKDLPEYKQRQ